MEETKYYTPTIEEFHIGFEYEVQQMEELCGSLTYTEEYASFNYEFGDEINLERVRVKYLDQEDIESFGFKLWTHKGNELGFMRNTDKEGSTWIHRIEGKIKISTTFPDTTLYLGIIKNKSELKRVLQQLEII